ncbi:uncharacterized protein LAESUDRAFT_712074 [Laetiporus sulphureus 93-53]|uniref:Uncharacterized protein n=1 Tax=Laetiporus sulphureus 93-53 TaxID=1314785 RepID=A0A165FXQ4_9APHY|nr:uncharacterized protein LAESUDRAFT_712074 [Laetiporus sulphureus 93-53]KZT09554.1 hypothetical protein LAESUDRAFT_712074 [Laetiporus sulphureus 93-53]
MDELCGLNFEVEAPASQDVCWSLCDCLITARARDRYSLLPSSVPSYLGHDVTVRGTDSLADVEAASCYLILDGLRLRGVDQISGDFIRIWFTTVVEGPDADRRQVLCGLGISTEHEAETTEMMRCNVRSLITVPQEAKKNDVLRTKRAGHEAITLAPLTSSRQASASTSLRPRVLSLVACNLKSSNRNWQCPSRRLVYGNVRSGVQVVMQLTTS